MSLRKRLGVSVCHIKIPTGNFVLACLLSFTQSEKSARSVSPLSLLLPANMEVSDVDAHSGGREPTYTSPLICSHLRKQRQNRPDCVSALPPKVLFSRNRYVSLLKLLNAAGSVPAQPLRDRLCTVIIKHRSRSNIPPKVGTHRSGGCY